MGVVFLFLLPLFLCGAVHAAPDPVFSSFNVLPFEDIGYGELQTYDFEMINNGTDPAQGVTVTVTVPVDGSGNYMEIVSVSTGYTQNNEVLTCTLGDLAAGATASLSVVVRATLAPGTPALGVMGELSYSGSGVVSNITQDIAIHPASSQSQADLSLSMTAAPNPVNVNEEVTFGLTVTNLGGPAGGPAEPARGAAVSNVTVTTHLPTGMTFVRASSGCSSSAGVVTCNFGSLADSATATVTIVARAPAAAASSLVTQADVSGNLPDPAPGNNTARVSISVVTGSASAVPTLSEWGTIFLGLILAGAAIGMIRRREAV
jgi:hypothetical protein